MPFSDISKWTREYPLLKDIVDLKPVLWINENRKLMGDIQSIPVNMFEMREAAKLMKRFAPFLSLAFPEIKKTNGIIESALRPIPQMKEELNQLYSPKISGRLFLKCDNELPVAGSVKARGGFYEVLYYAEQLAIKSGMLKEGDNYEIFGSEKFKDLFRKHSIGVGSTGNLGMSIGIMSAKLGFKVSVYMSADAKEWKKHLLRNAGANVVEFTGDFGEAITAGRSATLGDPNGYFVDDENSKHLFLGYSTAAFELQKQLEEQQIIVDESHPLFVYSPCGVGGSPGGIAFGLKQIFGDNVHGFFAEPTHSPSVLIGLLTDKMEKVSVHDFGIDNVTEADGLAVGRPSAFATAISKVLISGDYTIDDNELFKLLFLIKNCENICLEPSATAGLAGPQRITGSNYIQKNNLIESNVTHIVWATGGALVPKEEMEEFYKKGGKLLSKKYS